jgi:RsiW-degrading membrane proteinase PrsW (M82 family)
MSEVSSFLILICVISLLVEVVMFRDYYSKNASTKKPTVLICTTIVSGLLFGLLLSTSIY